eukprot:g42642.t1
MDDITVFCSDLLSALRLVDTCDHLELASGVMVNRGKNEAMFFGNWAGRSFILFTVRTDYLKVLTCAVAVPPATIYFTWRCMMECVRRDTMNKILDTVGKNIPNAALVLMTTLVCSCIKLCIDPQYTNTKCHYVLSFFLSPSVMRDVTSLFATEHSAEIRKPQFMDDDVQCILTRITGLDLEKVFKP